MAESTQAPWAVSPYGYCSARTPFKKICLPPGLLRARHELQNAIAHEYGHVICMTLTKNRAPRWLEEAVAVLEERQFDRKLMTEFASGRIPWKSAAQLEASFNLTDDPNSVWRAYQQSGLIGRYMANTYGETRLHELLDAMGNSSFLVALVQQLWNRSNADTALRKVFGLSEVTLFKRALKSILEQSGRTTALRP